MSALILCRIGLHSWWTYRWTWYSRACREAHQECRRCLRRRCFTGEQADLMYRRWQREIA